MEEKLDKIEKDIKDLGILGIEAYGDLTSDCISDAIKAVKSINLDFKKSAQKAVENAKHPSR